MYRYANTHNPSLMDPSSKSKSPRSPRAPTDALVEKFRGWRKQMRIQSKYETRNTGLNCIFLAVNLHLVVSRNQINSPALARSQSLCGRVGNAVLKFKDRRTAAQWKKNDTILVRLTRPRPTVHYYYIYLSSHLCIGQWFPNCGTCEW